MGFFLNPIQALFSGLQALAFFGFYGNTIKAPYFVTFTESTSCFSTTSFRITKPAALRLGDLLIAYMWSDSVQTGLAGPGGWTKNFGPVNVNSSYHSSYFYKVATSTETAAANFTFTHSGGSHSSCGIAAFVIRNVSQSTPIGAGTTQTVTYGGGSSTLTFPSVTTTEPHSAVLLLAEVNSSNPTTPTNYTSIYYSANMGAEAFLRVYPALTTTGTATSTVAGFDNFAAHSIILNR